jgi:hypothetical protein
MLLPAAAAALALLPAAASGAVHSSSITVPGGTSFLTDDVDAGTQLSVRGTYNADDPGDTVDVRCTGDSTLTFKNDVGANGSFNTSGALSSIVPSATTAPHMNVCRLRAVSHGSSPSNLAPFAGPIVAVGRLSRGFFTFATGPNADQLADTYFGAPQLTGMDDYEGLGDCGLQDALLVDPATLKQSQRLFFCNDWYSATDNWPGPSRAQLRIDGQNTYAPSAIDGNFDHVDLSLSAGYPDFTFGPTRDPANGNVTINETDELAQCASGDPYPPTTGNCPTLTGSGVRVERSIVQDHGGRVVRIVDRFVSDDGAAHTFDGWVENDFLEGSTGYRFPWVDGADYHTHSATDGLPGAPGAPASIYVKGDIGAADGDATHPQGAITFGSAPDAVRFTSPTTFQLHYHGTVPAPGPLTLVFTYSMASRFSDVAGYAHDAEDQDSAPVVSISNPVNGATVGSANLNLRGFATDNGGVTGLSINGTPVTLGPGGAFSLPVKLPLGTSTFTASATDRFGNVGQAQVQVTYAKCVVPNVRHQKLSSARKRLAAAHCAAKIRKAYSAKIKPWRVIKQGSKKGTVRTLGRHITLTVSKGKKPRHRRHR